MKNSNNKKLLILAVSVTLLIIFAPYIATFGKYGLSDKHQAWANFGGYVGGVLGPIISGLAFIYIIKTFRIQKIQLDDAEKKAQLIEISEIIRFFLKKVDEILSEKVNVNGEGVMSVKTALSALHSQEGDSSTPELDKQAIKSSVDEAVTLDQTFTLISTLSILCDLYDEFNKLGGSKKILAAYINSHLEAALGIYLIEKDNKRIPDIKRYYYNPNE